MKMQQSEKKKYCSVCSRGEDCNKCKEIRDGYKDVGMEFMLKYTQWPTGDKPKTNRLRYLFAKHLNCEEIKGKGCYISLAHFHPKVVEEYEGKRFPKYISKAIGKSIGLSDNDINDKVLALPFNSLVLTTLLVVMLYSIDFTVLFNK